VAWLDLSNRLESLIIKANESPPPRLGLHEKGRTKADHRPQDEAGAN
jgi:hypothetical protein